MVVKSYWLMMFLCIALAMPLASSLTINPLEYRIHQIDFDKSYSIIATVVNSESAHQDVRVEIAQNSQYLSKYVKLEENRFSLSSFEKKNLIFTLKIPKDALSPEEHIITFDFYSGNELLGKFSIKFNIAGERKDDLRLLEIKLENTSQDKPLYIEFSLKNSGNVIARATPMVEVFDGNRFIERFGQESQVIIMPDKEYNLTILYDVSKLQLKPYTIKAYFIYANGLTTNTLQKEFTVLPKKTYQENEKLIKRIKPGESLVITLLLENPSGQESKYSTEYYFEGTDIRGIKEGEISSTKEQVSLNIQTDGLKEGDYNLIIETRTGKALERLETETIRVVVHKGYNSYIQLSLAVIGLLLISFYYLRYHMSEENKAKRKLSSLKSIATSLSSNYDKDEARIKSLAKDVSDFIAESNQWLDSHYGRGRYGFK
ncbi:MAG: hypothetical protein QXK37_01900 [Candidatus Woesearchaeota archaeon]